MATATGRETRSARNRAGNNNGSTEKPKIEGKTDHTRWRLKDDDSRHTWHYLTEDSELEKWPQSNAEKYYLNLPLVSREPLEAQLFLGALPRTEH